MYSAQQILQKELWSNGPSPGQFYNFTGGSQAVNYNNLCKEYTAPGVFGTQHISSPVTTGTSVLGIKFDGGVMIAADNLVSYGSLARYQDVQRAYKINDKAVLGVGGDFADFQSLKRSIDQKIIEDTCYGDNIDMKPKSLLNWLTRVLYNRRIQMNPLWLDLVIGGLENDGEPFLGHIDCRGRSYNDDIVATGVGTHMALPLMRQKLTEGKKLTQEEASQLLHKCMEVLYYRDCRAMPKYTVAICSKKGSIVQGPFSVNENWKLATMVKGY